MRVLWVGVFLMMTTTLWSAAASEIPFQYREGLIWLRVSVPGATEPLSLLLDSGAAASVLDCETARRLGLKLGERVSVRGVHSQQVARWTQPLTAKLGDVAFSQKFLAVDLHQLSQSCAQPVDGLLGADFFHGR